MKWLKIFTGTLVAALFVLAICNEIKAQTLDFNLITAVDISTSVSAEEEEMQYLGLAVGVTDYQFLQNISNGVGFTVFAFSSGGEFRIIVPWTVIRTPEDAAMVSEMLRQAPRVPRDSAGLPVSVSGINYSRVPSHMTGMTDIGLSIDSAVRLSAESPLPANRTVINILSDGQSNQGRHPRVARDEAVALGFTINGITFGDEYPELNTYFRSFVIGGPGAFVERAETAVDLIPLLEKKFWQDMISSR